MDLLNLNLDNHDLAKARTRIDRYMNAFEKSGVRMTENLDFDIRPVTDAPRRQEKAAKP